MFYEIVKLPLNIVGNNSNSMSNINIYIFELISSQAYFFNILQERYIKLSEYFWDGLVIKIVSTF